MAELQSDMGAIPVSMPALNPDKFSPHGGANPEKSSVEIRPPRPMSGVLVGLVHICRMHCPRLMEALEALKLSSHNRSLNLTEHLTSGFYPLGEGKLGVHEALEAVYDVGSEFPA